MTRGPYNCTGIILSAGASSRMGRHKALLDWQGQPIIAAHCETMAQVCGRVIVVLGASAEEIRTRIPEHVDVRINPRWAETQMADSLRIGLHGVNGPCLVTPVDTPPAPTEILERIIKPKPPVVPCFRGQDGHPVWVDASRTHRSLADQTLSEVLRTAPRISVTWPDCILSWNTPEEWGAHSSASAANRSRSKDS